MASGNGPNWDRSCWKISIPLLEDFVQFYLGTWMHMRGVYPSHMEGQRRHEAAWSKCILVKEGKPNKLVLEPLNFADDMVRGDDGRKRAVFKTRSEALFINLDWGGLERSTHLLASSLRRWYLEVLF